MKIYLAGSCSSDSRSLMMNMKKIIISVFGTEPEIYCPFELKIPDAWSLSQEAWSRAVFDADIEALRNSDLMIMISYGRTSSAGVNWEQGFAFANNIPIFVLQVTDAPTSLMTYCGCKNFYNTGSNLEDITRAIKFIYKNWNKDLVKGICETVLT